MLPTLLLVLSQTQAIEPKSACILAESVLIRGVGNSAIRIAGKWSRIDWSPDGSTLVLGKDTGGCKYSLEFWRNGSTSVKVDKPASWPSWSQNGQTATFSTDDGVYLLERKADEPNRLMPTGSDPAISPDGRRIAFAMQGAKGGLWICDPKGSGLRRIVRDFKAMNPAWAWHGRTIAFIAAGKEAPKPMLYTANADGRNLTSLCLADPDTLEWAPSGKRILIRQGSRFAVCDSETGKTNVLPETVKSRPYWLTPSKLVGLQNGIPAVFEAGQSSMLTSPYPYGAGEPIMALAPYRGLVMEGRLPDPFASADRPRPGQLRITGWISSADPFDQRYAIQIHTSVAPNGSERGYGRPLMQIVTIGATSSRSGRGRSAPLRSTDLRQDDEVSLIVNGTDIGNLDPLTIDKAYIPSLSDAPSRQLQGNGKVPFGMVFPVVGKVRWSDTFGADRDGGARKHQGTDIMAPKMRPLVAAFNGTVWFNKGQGARSGKHLSIDGDNGWSCAYMHINNDTPGTDDGIGDDRYAFAPGLKPSDHVYAGQIIAFVGDSGNAESTSPHLHFELYGPYGLVNPAPVLKLLKHLDRPLYKNGFDIVPLAKDESQWDGIIKSVDASRKVVAIELVAKRSSVKPLTPVFSPSDVYIRFDGDGKLQFAGNENVKVAFEDLRPGLVLSAVGTKPSGGSVLSRLMIVDFPTGS